MLGRPLAAGAENKSPQGHGDLRRHEEMTALGAESVGHGSHTITRNTQMILDGNDATRIAAFHLGADCPDCKECYLYQGSVQQDCYNML